MKKKVSLVLSSAVLLFSLSTGTASANGTLDGTVEELLGTPYKWGGTSQESGFDCSGFILNVFKEFEIELPRTSKTQANAGDKIAKSDLRAGDLVFFNIDGKGISHAGIYIRDGKFAHSASNKGVSISKLSDSYYAKSYVTARRIASEEDYLHMITEPSTAE
ncbi:C40 family peptidase [Paenibacillus sp. SYP-B3998]|uniref:C40 family peptidase n=1 Tax=Paenibacillus sp. SYP-B3998 TaxID=2678564 RepID=A0A6G4A2P6_9BACL|nr:C40 family peptidase [Paenibacillus sp. SYP-B3998]NEW08600.1 C40 family peptidase [Paenibacillus sp. SYP-B3998]